jgi:Ca2+-binding EF-hand superfamily protein
MIITNHNHLATGMVDKLRPDELAAFKSAFDMFDKNSDGTISTKVPTSVIAKMFQL